MIDDARPWGARGLCHRKFEALEDYGIVRPHLPLSDLSLLPLSVGEFRVGSSLVGTDEVTLLQTRVDSSAIGVNVIRSTHVAFAFVGPKSGALRVNGDAARTGDVCMAAEAGNDFYFRGGGRTILGAAIRKESFIETCAALSGSTPDSVALKGGVLELPPGVGGRSYARLASIIDRAGLSSKRDVEKEAIGLLVELYLRAHPDDPNGTRDRSVSDDRIVRRAEERFASAEGGPVSLADLCAAAGVGKTRLYQAFHSLCGEPPLTYFRRRRLVSARTRLLASDPERGAVKRVALDLGLTEFGRFACEYRSLFGELPSATLSRSA